MNLLSIRIAAEALLLRTSMSMSARDRSNARSMVITRYGIVAPSHVQAVLHDSKSKVNYGASDARAEGAAVPEH